MIPTLQLESLFQQMRGTKLKKFSAILMLLLRNLGTFEFIVSECFILVQLFSFFSLCLGVLLCFDMFNVNKQVRNRAGVHLVATRSEVAYWVASRWLSWTTGYILSPLKFVAWTLLKKKKIEHTSYFTRKKNNWNCDFNLCVILHNFRHNFQLENCNFNLCAIKTAH